MNQTEPRIDAYIEKAQAFARPVLEHLRALIHKICPAVEEKIKWGIPHFDYKRSMMCNMAAFKQHLVFGFWKASIMHDLEGLFDEKVNTAMGSMGRITTLKDLPSDKILTAYIKEAMRLNDEDIKLPVANLRKGKQTPEPETPADLAALLDEHPQATTKWESFAPSHRREYIDWIVSAKTVPTREKRLATTIEWLIEGKSKNWKYK
jgi:uncharacterized protein YdeI (YjbR/CyaY-like superfamily)